MTTRRSLLASILAAGAAPMIARAGVLMPIQTIAPAGMTVLYRDGIRNGFPGYMEVMSGRPAWDHKTGQVIMPCGPSGLGFAWLPEGKYSIGGGHYCASIIDTELKQLVRRGAITEDLWSYSIASERLGFDGIHS